ncbi:AlpA family phage regulatory protein [Vibrio sp. SCSIO 43133]|uniref:helix-turn-helix transcriptional regulator n=1 Tax=Vibrio sp. SCSIO 43133 TaxID=2802577 RepID=UPI0020754EE2|nr:AlpA family phage regulatory protein [Vibrio sp. SCSIO 43133]USE00695.1 AlpA family phage regulatory protein [Vibrio sp. SCSIO 43133]
MAPEKLISIKEMMNLLGKARPTLYKMVKEGRFPQPVKVNNRTQGWTVSSYQNWIESHS